MNPTNLSLLKKLVSLIDLTTLNPSDNEETIINLCHKATTNLGNVAAVCVYPKFVRAAKETLSPTKIKIASVANFPSGEEKIQSALNQIEQALTAGATEIDIVFPYVNYKQGQKKEALNYIEQCKKECNQVTLKVILEISEFSNAEEIYELSQRLIELEVNFLKTSTGKSKHGATIEGAETMLRAIKDFSPNTGFKASGGIKNVAQANAYTVLAEKIMGSNWVNPDHFRIGASSLLDEILTT